MLVVVSNVCLNCLWRVVGQEREGRGCQMEEADVVQMMVVRKEVEGVFLASSSFPFSFSSFLSLFFVIVRLFSFCFSSLHFFFLAFLSFPCTMAGDAMPMLTMMSTRAFWLTLGAYALVVVLGAGLGFGLCLSTALSSLTLFFPPHRVCV